LAECGRAAAHEKSAREPGREPETFHDSDELTNFAAAAQQNVRECQVGENPFLAIAASTGVTLTSLLSLAKGEATRGSAELRQFNRKSTEDFY
jgi:predicted RNA-binding Zn ribbon-like protein